MQPAGTTKIVSCAGAYIEYTYGRRSTGNLDVTPVKILTKANNPAGIGNADNDPRFVSANVDFGYSGGRSVTVGLNANTGHDTASVPASPDGTGYSSAAIHPGVAAGINETCFFGAGYF